jgi:invasion protein IalB
MTIRRAAVVAAAVAVLATSLAATGRAQETRLLGTYGRWKAYTVEHVGRQICYIASKPTKEEGKYAKRGEVWALVSHQPQKDSQGTVQFVAGYKYKDDAEVIVTVDDNSKFTLFTDNQDAWAYEGEDGALIEAMKRGRRMVVQGQSWRDTETKDNYSLRGFTRAYKAIGEACGLP